MKIFLVIVFFNALNQPMYLDGWYPMQMKSIEQCERARDFAHNYIETLMEEYPPGEGILGFDVFCKVD